MARENRFLKNLLFLLVATVACAGCNSNIPFKALTQTSEATLVSTAINTPIPTSKSIAGWLTYRNAVFRYELSYPPQASLSTEGVTGYPTEELLPNTTPEEYLTKLAQMYPGDLCVRIQYRFGFVTIEAPQDKGGKYTGPCGVTGVGDYDVIEKTEIVNIGGRSYSVTGYEVHQRDASATFRSEFFKVQLEDGTRIDYGGNWTDDGETYKDYLPVKEVLLQILASYQKSEYSLIGGKCNSENCLFVTEAEGDFPIGVTTISGYYAQLERSAFEQTKQCDSFIITEGPPALIQSLLSLIKQGNTVYTKNDLDQPIVSLDLNMLTESEKQRLISSSVSKPLSIVLLATNPIYQGVPVCFSHFEILRVE